MIIEEELEKAERRIFGKVNEIIVWEMKQTWKHIRQELIRDRNR